MVGLLDALKYTLSQGGGGLLDSLMHPSPLAKEGPPQQPEYDAMGNFTGVVPQTAKDPFGPIPQMDKWAQQFAPASPFNTTAPVAPVQQFAGVPIQPQAEQPAPQPAPPEAAPPQRMMSIGGYQMPQMGSAAEYTPPPMPTDVSAQRRAPAALATPNTQPEPPGGSFMTGFRNWASTKEGDLFGGIANAIEGATTGKRTDAAGIQRENITQIYNSLLPVLGKEKAMAAALDPEVRKVMVQSLDKQQPEWKVLRKDGDGNEVYGWADPRNQNVKEYSPAGSKADTTSDGIAGPDGKMIPYPEGANAQARKIFADTIMRANADAASGKFTEVQAKSLKFGNQMEVALKNIDGLAGEGTSLFGQIASNVPLGNFVQSPAYRTYVQGKNSFLTALLRDESGAAIGSQEFIRREKELFPQPGDDPKIMQNKAEARKVVLEGMRKAAGPGYKPPQMDAPKVRKYNPTTGAIE